MIPNKNPKRFIEEYGNWWYLREFDYFPEPLEYYNKELNHNAIQLILNSKERDCGWRLFDNIMDAKKASNEVREALGLMPLYIGKNLETIGDVYRRMYNK